MKIVGISSCPTGIAHTYMAAEAIRKEGEKYGFSVKMENQGQLGQENIVTQQEFDEADAIVLCCGVLPIAPERYEKYPEKIVEVDYNMILKQPHLLIDALKAAGLVADDIQKIK